MRGPTTRPDVRQLPAHLLTPLREAGHPDRELGSTLLARRSANAEEDGEVAYAVRSRDGVVQ
eukprot:3690187-Alexandrium_andersonii.AAC.1